MNIRSLIYHNFLRMFLPVKNSGQSSNFHYVPVISLEFLTKSDTIFLSSLELPFDISITGRTKGVTTEDIVKEC